MISFKIFALFAYENFAIDMQKLRHTPYKQTTHRPDNSIYQNEIIDMTFIDITFYRYEVL